MVAVHKARIMVERPKHGQTALGYARRMHSHLLEPLLSRLTHPNVRDLAWTLLSPPLIESTLQRHPLTGSTWARRPPMLAEWLLEQDHQPATLIDWLAGTSRRLGLYYERLWQFGLAHAPGISLIAANIPVRDEGRTLGELDVLFEDGEGMHHLELAVKFYLGPIDLPERAQCWVGPGAEDRLDLKLSRLEGDQLSLAPRPQARTLLATLGAQQPTSRFWMGGYLFHPAGPATAPAGAAQEHLRGEWLRPAQWQQSLDETSVRWQPLERLRWLAPLRTDEAWENERLRLWLGSHARQPASLMVALRPTPQGHWQEVRRAFWLDEHWPAHAPAGG